MIHYLKTALLMGLAAAPSVLAAKQHSDNTKNPSSCCATPVQPSMQGGYNQKARQSVKCPWDMYVDASFLYLQTLQDDMSVGAVNHTAGVNTSQIPDTNPAGAFPFGFSGNVVNMDFDYQPGFQVEFGGYLTEDDWDLSLQYTWLHGSQTETLQAQNNQQIFPVWGQPLFLGNNVYNTAFQSWNVKLDIAEFNLGRWYYVGKNLTFHPTLGARASWIRQNLAVNYSNYGTLGIGTIDFNSIGAKTRSWGLGPQASMETNWLLGSGFRFYGYGEADILFTDYTKADMTVRHTNNPTFSMTASQIYTLRPHLDFELGFGWSSYSFCDKWYIDLSAGYDFQVFFNQNMFPNYNDDLMIAQNISPRGNLYLQGLTIRAKLDF